MLLSVALVKPWQNQLWGERVYFFLHFIINHQGKPGIYSERSSLHQDFLHMGWFFSAFYWLFTCWNREEALWGLFDKDIIHGVLPLQPSHIPYPLSSNAIMFSLIFDMNFGRIKYSVSISSSRSIAEYFLLLNWIWKR